MATWTEKQIALLSGPSLELYKRLTSQGMRPADALNQVISKYGLPTGGSQPTSTTSSAQFRSAEATIAGTANATEQQIMQTLQPFDIQTTRFEPENVQPAFESAGSYSAPAAAATAAGKKIVGTYVDANGNVIAVYDDGSTAILSYGEKKDTTPTLARDTFKKTIALMFGNEAMTAGWVDELYGVVSGFYKTGSSVDESLNLALRDVRDNPNLKQFTNRFRGIFALEDRLRKGESVYVPTIAEYTGIQQKMSDVFNAAGLGDLATLDFTSDLISKNLSVAETANRINNVFSRIDNAPDALKSSFREYFPMLTKTDLAKSLLLGEQGARELEQKVAGIEVKSAAVQQGLVASDPFNLARSGVTYSQALRGYGRIAQFMPTAEKLSAMQGGTFTMPEAESAIFGVGGSGSAEQELRTLGRRESNLFSGSSGVGQSSLGSGIQAGSL